VIGIDRLPERLALARDVIGSETIDYSGDESVLEQLRELTGGRGPDACIDAVGNEGHHGHFPVQAYDRVKQAMRQETERAHAVREAIFACKPGGIVSVVGAYGGFMDKFPLGPFMNKGLTMRTGQCHVQRYLKPLLEHIKRGDLDPSFVVTHRLGLDSAPEGYETFKHKTDSCMKVVLKP
jgi:threonine dehydrogenase-like Zn-dependent dehydrogenase